MSIESFGYQVLSLRETLDQLKELSERLPELLDQPVWIGGRVPLYQPVKQVMRAQHGAMLVVETGE